jgi:hypothetical protein
MVGHHGIGWSASSTRLPGHRAKRTSSIELLRRIERVMPIERLFQQCFSGFTLLIWIAAIVVPFFGIATWWTSVPIAIVWQVGNGWIALGIMKQILPADKFAEVIEKTKRGETL